MFNAASTLALTPIDDGEREHIEAIQRSVAAGFAFLHLRDPDGGAVAAIHAERWRDGTVDTHTIQSMRRAAAVRYRVEDYPNGAALWQTCGTVAEVVTELLALPRHGMPGAPTRAHRLAVAFSLTEVQTP
ncbi:MAG: hypothetical protein GEU98_17065 [Pseudonocardiaceae bacterium]|nr:hypothetical protein [Pseudonocardiaceae bacterium]